MASSSGSARVAGLRVTAPLTAAWASTIKPAPPRREVRPDLGRVVVGLSFAIVRHRPQRPRDLGPGDHAIAATHLDDLEPLARCLIASAELVDQAARLTDVAQIEHLADTLGFQRRIGREQQRFDDVSRSRHDFAPHSVPWTLHWVPWSGVRSQSLRRARSAAF